MKTQSLILLVVLIASATREVVAELPPRPNILYFYVDDMGWGSIGPNGQADRKAGNLPYVRTPNLNRLAARGVNFTRGYGCTVCSPARSTLQTGFHQGHTFADRNDPNNAKKAIRADDISIGTALSSVGYATGYWGKWGYGGSKDRINPVIENVQTLPTSHGYKHVLAELHHVRAHTFFQPTLWSAPASPNAKGGLALVPNSVTRYKNGKNWPKQPALQNHSNYPTTAYCDDTYAFAALDFVRRQGQEYNISGQPFFGLLAVQIPHAPFQEIATLPEWDRAYEDDPHFETLSDQTRQWAAMVTRIDAHFGNLLAALEDPNNDGDPSDSIAVHTLVVFQSDNGGPSGKNNVELDANGGLSGNKGKIQEGGIRVPLVMCWPEKITPNAPLKAGTNSEMVVDVSDMLPTFCELAGAPVPLGIDGVSIAPTLLGLGHQRRREFIIHEAGNGQSIIRGNQKLVRSKNGSLTLFDLNVDPAESTSIAAEHPQIVRELETLLLGERVTEPKGFANTYHYWTGNDGDKTSNPRNWSDYKYTNAGITYLTDSGAPRLSWIAHIKNTDDKPSTAFADKDLNVLGLEIRGNRTTQSLVLGSNVNITGRNEIRLAKNSTVTVNGGTVSSLRWIDIHSNALLEGHGAIDATIYNNGSISVKVGRQSELSINGDLHQTDSANVKLPMSRKMPALTIRGKANLAGVLKVIHPPGFKSIPGKTYPLISAERVSGTFSNPRNEVVGEDGSRYSIVYSKSAVTLTSK